MAGGADQVAGVALDAGGGELAPDPRLQVLLHGDREGIAGREAAVLLAHRAPPPPPAAGRAARDGSGRRLARRAADARRGPPRPSRLARLHQESALHRGEGEVVERLAATACPRAWCRSRTRRSRCSRRPRSRFCSRAAHQAGSWKAWSRNTRSRTATALQVAGLRPHAPPGAAAPGPGRGPSLRPAGEDLPGLEPERLERLRQAVVVPDHLPAGARDVTPRGRRARRPSPGRRPRSPAPARRGGPAAGFVSRYFTGGTPPGGRSRRDARRARASGGGNAHRTSYRGARARPANDGAGEGECACARCEPHGIPRVLRFDRSRRDSRGVPRCRGIPQRWEPRLATGSARTEAAIPRDLVPIPPRGTGADTKPAPEPPAVLHRRPGQARTGRPAVWQTRASEGKHPDSVRRGARLPTRPPPRPSTAPRQAPSPAGGGAADGAGSAVPLAEDPRGGDDAAELLGRGPLVVHAAVGEAAEAAVRVEEDPLRRPERERPLARADDLLRPPRPPRSAGSPPRGRSRGRRGRAPTTSTSPARGVAYSSTNWRTSHRPERGHEGRVVAPEEDLLAPAPVAAADVEAGARPRRTPRPRGSGGRRRRRARYPRHGGWPGSLT